jgi:hypothetical protein
MYLFIQLNLHYVIVENVGLFFRKSTSNLCRCLFLGKLCKDLPLENINKKFGKYILEVNKRATTIEFLGEIGRFPLMLEVIVNMLSYYVGLYHSKDKLVRNTVNF